MTEKRAIVVVSFGQRPWLGHCIATLAPYAARCGASLHVETAPPTQGEFPFPDLPDSPGRPYKLAYACKIYMAWKHLEAFGFDRVLILDDSALARPGAADIFAVAPESGCSGVGARRNAEASFDFIRDWAAREGRDEPAYDPSAYLNGAVTLFSRDIRAALRPDLIAAAADLCFAGFPHQTLLYYLLARGGVRPFLLPRGFNVLPGVGITDRLERRRMRDVRPYLGAPEQHLFHVSGAYEARAHLIRQMSEAFLGQATVSQPQRLG